MSRRGENIYKRKDGRWEGRILKADGSYKYVYGQSYKEVKEKKKSFVEKAPSAKKYGFANSGVGDLFQQWLANCAMGRVKRSTYDSYYYCIEKYVLPFFKKDKLDQITDAQVARFAQSIYFNGRISTSYKRKILAIFKTALTDILKKAGRDLSVLNALEMPQHDYGLLNVFSVHEQCLIERQICIEDDKKAYGILLCFYTGIRLGELCSLKWADIDIDAKVLTITGTVSRIKSFDESSANKTDLIVSTPKSRNSIRRLPLPDFIISVMKSHLPSGSADYFFLTGTEKPADPRTMQRFYKRLLKEAGVKDRKFHTLRHTFATRALEMGVDIKTLSEILGHSNVSITLNIYAHSMMEQKKIAISKMDTMYINHIDVDIPLFAVANTVSQEAIPW